jgi:rhodanese-related sulfurtransferase
MRFLSGLLFFLSLNFCFLSGQIPDSVKFQSLEPHDFKLQYLNTGSSLLIDVREPFEFKGKRIKDAINIPASGNLERAADTLNREYTLFLYCTSGYRSARVAESLYKKGFRNLVSLKGGIIAWKKEGMPVVKGAGRKAHGTGRSAGDSETP